MSSLNGAGLPKFRKKCLENKDNATKFNKKMIEIKPAGKIPTKTIRYQTGVNDNAENILYLKWSYKFLFNVMFVLRSKMKLVIF